MTFETKSRMVALAGLMVVAGAAPGRADDKVDPQIEAKQELVGGGLALGYTMDHCDIATTGKQRSDFQAKMAALKHDTGMTGDLSEATIKDMIGLKSDDDVKKLCLGAQLTFPASLAGFLAGKPPGDWLKPETAAATAPAAVPAKRMAGDWEVEPIDGVAGSCMITRDYNDANDDNAENVVILRNMSDGLLLGVTYAKWNWTSGQQTSAPLVTKNSVVAKNVNWTSDKTGKTLTATLPNDTQAVLAKADKIILKFPDGDAYFETPGLGDALTALTACAQGK